MEVIYHLFEAVNCLVQLLLTKLQKVIAKFEIEFAQELQTQYPDFIKQTNKKKTETVKKIKCTKRIGTEQKGNG